LQMIQAFIDSNRSAQVYPIDTARIYANGVTESIVGLAVPQLSLPLGASLSIGTKAHPSEPGGLSRPGIASQLSASRQACFPGQQVPGSPVFAEFYLHQPDQQTPVLESLQYLHELKREGTIGAIGLSNYHASEVARIFDLCRIHDLTPPTVYQGLYNPLNRLVETELLPVLRANHCAFVAYNPLAGGLMSGKHVTQEDAAAPGRFANQNPNYVPRFLTTANFRAVDALREALESYHRESNESISMVEASYRWLVHHSVLQAQDGIIIGASSLTQLQQNLRACCQHPLPARLAHCWDNAWPIVCAESAANSERIFPYWRSYSADMPHRKALDPGAAYNPAQATTK
jgi:aflatoxin B1 aldehyde reductase